MWPWGHLAVGYLVYAGYVWIRHRRSPAGWPVVALAIGTQFPDLVDKPLAYWVGVLPEGRSLAHSLLVVVPLWVIVLLDARRYRRQEVGIAFVIGYATHLLGDCYGALLGGRWGAASYLLWPVLAAPDYPAEDFAHHAEKLVAALGRLDPVQLVTTWDDPFIWQFWLAIGVVLLWVVQGMPPLAAISNQVRR